MPAAPELSVRVPVLARKLVLQTSGVVFVSPPERETSGSSRERCVWPEDRLSRDDNAVGEQLSFWVGSQSASLLARYIRTRVGPLQAWHGWSQDTIHLFKHCILKTEAQQQTMAPLYTTAASLLLLAASAHAHFKLLEPPSIGFADDDEGKGPCGSFTPDFSKDNVTEFHVGGQPVALLSTHPETKWLFRATFDEKAEGEWQQLHPVVDQQGIGDFCLPAVKAPDSWAGRTGVIGVVADAPDGQLFQVCGLF